MMSSSRWRTARTAAAGTLFVLGLLQAMVSPVDAQGPELRLIAPADGAVINDTTVTVQFEVTNVAIVPSSVPLEEAGQHPEANLPGEGHLHLMLDLDPLVVWERNEAYVFANVPPGDHLLMVELVNNDHAPLSPPVTHQVRFRNVGAQLMPATGAAEDGDAWVQRFLLMVALCSVTLGAWMVHRDRTETPRSP